MAATTTATILRDSTANWIQSPQWDAFWMFSAIWGSALLLAVASAFGLAAAAPVLLVANIFIAVAHSWSTTFMVIGSPLLAAARQRNRWKFSAMPAIVVLASIALGLAVSSQRAYPASMPLTADNALWVIYLCAFWVGHFWHFGNQDFGVLSVYRLRAGQTSANRRRIDKAYTVAMMFFLQPLVYFKAVATSPLGEAFYSYVPVSVETVTAAAACAVWVAAALTVAIVGFELCAPDRSLPKLLYYVVMLSHPVVLFLVHYRLGLYYFIGYFWSHWFIAIGLVGRINVNYYRDRGFARMQAIGRHLLSVGSIAAVAIALRVVYGRYDVFSGKDYKEVLGAVTPEYQLLLGLMLGLFLAEQLLHYYCDRSLFRFRDPDVRSAVAPLL